MRNKCINIESFSNKEKEIDEQGKLKKSTPYLEKQQKTGNYELIPKRDCASDKK